MNTLAASSVTAEELLRLSHPGKRVELVRGEFVVREPPAAWHGGISNNVAFRLTAFFREHDLGVVFGLYRLSDRVDPDTVRAPDVAFVRDKRLAEIPRRGYPRAGAGSDRRGPVSRRPPGGDPCDDRRVARWGGSAGLGAAPRCLPGACVPPRRQPPSARSDRRARRRGRAARLPLLRGGAPGSRMVARR